MSPLPVRLSLAAAVVSALLALCSCAHVSQQQQVQQGRPLGLDKCATAASDPLWTEVQYLPTVMEAKLRRRGAILGPFRCPICGAEEAYATDWNAQSLRESGRCSHCGGVNRQRQLAYVINHVASEFVGSRIDSLAEVARKAGMDIWNTEESGPMYEVLSGGGAGAYADKEVDAEEITTTLDRENRLVLAEPPAASRSGDDGSSGLGGSADDAASSSSSSTVTVGPLDTLNPSGGASAVVKATRAVNVEEANATGRDRDDLIVLAKFPAGSGSSDGSGNSGLGSSADDPASGASSRSSFVTEGLPDVQDFSRLQVALQAQRAAAPPPSQGLGGALRAGSVNAAAAGGEAQQLLPGDIVRLPPLVPTHSPQPPMPSAPLQPPAPFPRPPSVSPSSWQPVASPPLPPGGVEEGPLLPYPEASFDLVVSSDTLATLLDPYLAHRQILRLLRPGGSHVFTVPFDTTAPHDTLLDVRLLNGTLLSVARGHPQLRGSSALPQQQQQQGEEWADGQQQPGGQPAREEEDARLARDFELPQRRFLRVFGRGEMIQQLCKMGYQVEDYFIQAPKYGIVSGRAYVFRARRPPDAALLGGLGGALEEQSPPPSSTTAPPPKQPSTGSLDEEQQVLVPLAAETNGTTGEAQQASGADIGLEEEEEAVEGGVGRRSLISMRDEEGQAEGEQQQLAAAQTAGRFQQPVLLDDIVWQPPPQPAQEEAAAHSGGGALRRRRLAAERAAAQAAAGQPLGYIDEIY